MKKFLTYILVFLSVFADCSPKTPAKDPPGYHLNKPEKFLVSETLQEISGICFSNGTNDSIYAIQDEDGKIFKMALGDKKKVHTKFSGSGDYEDITYLRGNFFVLKSNGKIYKVKSGDTKYEEVDDVKEYKDLLPDGEYEAMYGDNASGLLYVMCKRCAHDAREKRVSLYALNILEPSIQVQRFEMKVDSLDETGSKVKHGFRPSGLALHPITKDWYIISAVNQLLVIADGNWHIKDFYRLSGNKFNQPEGIAFDSRGNMYISNEGDDLTSANILKFKYHSK